MSRTKQPEGTVEHEKLGQEMKTTFDANELKAFFDAFLPLRFPLPEGEGAEQADSSVEF